MFDGANQQNCALCGAGAILYKSDVGYSLWRLRLGGAQTIKWIWCLFGCPSYLGWKIVGDSKIVVEWFNEKGKIGVVCSLETKNKRDAS